MRKFQLKSGKMIEFSLAPIDKALALYRAVVSESRGAGLDLQITGEMTLADLLLKNTETILKVLGSEYVMDAVKECSDKVIYNGERFNMDLFEEEDARADFFGVMILVALENLTPFFPEARIVSSPILSQFLK